MEWQSLILAAAGTVTIVMLMRAALRSLRSTLQVTPVSEHWLAEWRGRRDAGVD
jgi:hypothetical protein